MVPLPPSKTNMQYSRDMEFDPYELIGTLNFDLELTLSGEEHAIRPGIECGLTENHEACAVPAATRV